MKKDILLIHGAGEGTYEWTLPFIGPLQNLSDHYRLHFPRMPDAGNPNYGKWKKALEEELSHIDENTVLIGHSLGGSVILKYFSENPGPKKFDALFLVAAPFWGEPGWDIPEFKLKKDFADHLTQFEKIYLLQNTDDEDVPFAHRDVYAKHLKNAVVLPATHSGHLSTETITQVANTIKS